MSWFQIGSGYYGLSAGSAELSQDDRNRAAEAFKTAFSIPSEEIRVDHPPAEALSSDQIRTVPASLTKVIS